MTHSVSFLHTSPAAIPPLMRFYGEAAPHLEITNQLDDGLLRLLRQQRIGDVRTRLAEMVRAAVNSYRAEAVMLTCSAIPPEVVAELGATARVPLFKIDAPMAEEAVCAGERLGVVVTFEPTAGPTSDLLRRAAAASGRDVVVVPSITPEAYDALLGGDPERHDALLLDAIDRLVSRGVDAIVLAQVSMARLLPKLEGRVGVPVFSSLTSSLGRIRQLLA